MDAICKVCELPIADFKDTYLRACPFCERSFRRVDAARRHARSCPARGNRPLPEVKRGRKSRACDLCFRDKTSCDSKFPCGRCSKKNTVCKYSAVCHDASHREEIQLRNYVETAGRDERMTLSFLLDWSDPNRDPMRGLMESESEHHSHHEAQEPAMPGLSAWLEETIDPTLLLLDQAGNNSCLGAESADGSFLGFSGDNLDVLLDNVTSRVQQLEHALQGSLTKTPSLQDGFDSTLRRGFFTADHIYRAFSTNRQKSSQLAPFMHWSTFQPEEVSPLLLLAALVLRTAYLDYSGQTYAAVLNTMFLELVEECIFFHLRDEENSFRGQHLNRPGPLFEICQAAAVIVSVQCTINNPRARERVATERIPYLVSILRKDGLFGAQGDHLVEGVGWENFVAGETRTRLAMSLHNNCALLSTFCNHPPAVAVREMTGPLPCNDNGLWEAEKRSEFDMRWSIAKNGARPPSFSEVSSMLLSDDLPKSDQVILDGLSVHQLFVVIIGFQNIVYSFRASMIRGDSTTSPLRALDRWVSLWARAIQIVPEDDIVGMGMIKIAPELAFLLKRVLEVWGTNEVANLGYFDGTVRYDTADLHEFVRRHGTLAPIKPAEG